MYIYTYTTDKYQNVKQLFIVRSSSTYEALNIRLCLICQKQPIDQREVCYALGFDIQHNRQDMDKIESEATHWSERRSAMRLILIFDYIGPLFPKSHIKSDYCEVKIISLLHWQDLLF